MWRQARDIRAYANEALAALGTADATTSQGASLRDELQGRSRTPTTSTHCVARVD
jgi:hypothetical protein